MTDLAELLADCDVHDIRLRPANDGGLAIDAPQNTLTPDLIGRLKAHKGELLGLLRPKPDVAPISEVVPFDDLPLPGPACPRCGSLEEWTDLLGGRHCGICEADTLDKALKLADRAARLRQQAQRRKPTPRIAPGCVAGGRVDTLDLDSRRPTQRQLCGLGGE